MLSCLPLDSDLHKDPEVAFGVREFFLQLLNC